VEDTSIFWYTDGERNSFARKIKQTVIKVQTGIDVDESVNDTTSRGIEHLMSASILQRHVQAKDAHLHAVMKAQEQHIAKLADKEERELCDAFEAATILARTSANYSKSSCDAALLAAAKDSAYVRTAW